VPLSPTPLLGTMDAVFLAPGDPGFITGTPITCAPRTATELVPTARQCCFATTTRRTPRAPSVSKSTTTRAWCWSSASSSWQLYVSATTAMCMFHRHALHQYSVLVADMGAGFAIGVRRSGSRPLPPGSPRVAVHIHYHHWVELAALCRDGLYFALARVRTEQAGLHAPLAAGGRAGRGSVASVSASVNSKKSGKSGASKGKDAKEAKKKGRSDGTKEKSKKGDAHAGSKTGADGARPAGWTAGNENTLTEVREDSDVVHSSQARIKVVM
jgi:hypothetical protein